MAEMPEIKITIDQEAMREQVAEPIRTVMRGVAMQLRLAADGLDGGEWWREHQAYVEKQIADARTSGLVPGRVESGDPS